MEQENSPPRFEFGDVLGTGFGVWLRNFIPFTVFAAAVFSPFIALWFFVRGKTMPVKPAMEDLGSIYAWALGKPLLLVFLLAVLQATIIHAVVEQLRGRRASMGTCFSAGASNLFRVVGIAFLVGIPVGFGLVCLILPGLMFWALWWIAVPICVMEDQGVTASMRTSWQTVKATNTFWSLVGLAGILVVIQIAIGLPFAILQGAFKFGTPQPLVGWAEVVSNILGGTLQAVMVAVVYHRLRMVHVEAFD